MQAFLNVMNIMVATRVQWPGLLTAVDTMATHSKEEFFIFGNVKCMQARMGAWRKAETVEHSKWFAQIHSAGQWERWD